MNSQDSLLIVVDVQGKLAMMMHEATRVHQSIIKTIEIAKVFSLPILWTEQAPDKIGVTIPEIASRLSDQKPIVKQSFSCYGAPEFVSQLNQIRRRHAIVVGIESHVCLYQTVRDLLKHGYKVDVVSDAIGARDAFNHQVGLDRMKEEGAAITSIEMLICDLLISAANPKFKQVMSIFKR